VTTKDTSLSTGCHGSTIPYFDGGIVRAGEEKMGRRGISITDSVDIIFVTLKAENRSLSFNVIDI